MPFRAPIQNLRCLDSLRIWEYSDRVLMEPITENHVCISLNRKDGKISVVARPCYQGVLYQPFTVIGFIGTIELLKGSYLLFVTVRKRVGSYLGRDVFEIMGTKVVSAAPLESKNLSQSGNSMDQQTAQEELKYLARVKRALSTSVLFYSYDIDLTTSLLSKVQEVVDKEEEEHYIHTHEFSREYHWHREEEGERDGRELGGEERELGRGMKGGRGKEAGKGKSVPLWRQAQIEYLWNRALIRKFASVREAEPFIIPIFQGSFHSFRQAVDGVTVDVTLIARRNVERIGTRMWRRGCSLNGHVANFVESEQIIEVEGSLTSSFVQVRGSIPLVWEQIVNLRYKPEIRLVKLDDPKNLPFLAHVGILLQKFKRVMAIDLVNQKGTEKRVGSAYAEAIYRAHNENYKYVAFDFHRECGHAHFEKLSVLFEKIKTTFDDFGFSLCDRANGKVLKQQTGVFRTNCIDCLDRTNVTQSMLARKMFNRQLGEVLKILKERKGEEPGEGDRDFLKEYSKLESAHNIIWADHGDDISMQYAGTPALKGDFVRFGSRTFGGILQDGISALSRYYFNNFRDGVRQDGLDLLVGNYHVDPFLPSPFAVEGLEKYLNAPILIGLFLVGVFLALCAATGQGVYRDPSSPRALHFTLWASLAGALGLVLKTFGRVLCDRPRLCKLR